MKAGKGDWVQCTSCLLPVHALTRCSERYQVPLHTKYGSFSTYDYRCRECTKNSEL